MILNSRFRAFALIVILGYAAAVLAAISEQDSRAPLKQFRPKSLPPFSDAEAKRLDKVVGRCSCLYDGKKFEGDSDTDCFIGGVSGSNRTIIGVGHLVRGFLEISSSPGELKCKFANNYGDKAVSLEIETGGYKIGTMDDSDKARDSLVVRMNRTIPGAQEIPVLPAGYELKPGTAFYAVSAGLQKSLQTKDLVAQECSVLIANSRQFFNDCSSIKGQSSGMVNLMRDAEGRIAAFGVTQGSSAPDKDGQPAVVRDSAGNPKPNNVTRSILLNQDVVQDILSIE